MEKAVAPPRHAGAEGVAAGFFERGSVSGLRADLIIAVTALEHGLALVTGNTGHFAWIPGVALQNWRRA